MNLDFFVVVDLFPLRAEEYYEDCMHAQSGGWTHHRQLLACLTHVLQTGSEVNGSNPHMQYALVNSADLRKDVHIHVCNLVILSIIVFGQFM